MTNRFNSAVLEGNWLEDRSKAPPLHGGISDFGFREYRPQYKDDYKAPTPGLEYTAPRHKLRYGMVCTATIDEAAYCYGDGEDGRPMFETMGGRDMSKKQIAELFRTVQTDSMAEASKIGAGASKTAAKDLKTLHHSEFAPAAGGAGAVKNDRGKHVVGMAGGKLELGADPRKNTMAQGSWMYGPHPSVKFILQPPPPREEITYMSIPGLGEKKDSNGKSLPVSKQNEDKSDIPLAKAGSAHGRYAAFAAETRTTTDVTATQSDMNKRAGRRVFADYP